METIQLYAPYVNTLGRAYLALRAQPSQADRQNSQTGAALSEDFCRKRICPENADCVFPVQGGGGGGGGINVQVRAHAVEVGSQGLGNKGRLKNAVHLRTVHDPVNDVTSHMGSLDNRRRENEDVEDVDHLGCAGFIRVVTVKDDVPQNDRSASQAVTEVKQIRTFFKEQIISQLVFFFG